TERKVASQASRRSIFFIFLPPWVHRCGTPADAGLDQAGGSGGGGGGVSSVGAGPVTDCVSGGGGENRLHENSEQPPVSGPPSPPAVGRGESGVDQQVEPLSA